MPSITGPFTSAEAENGPLTPDPLIAPHEGFVDEKVCTSCHAKQAAAFAKSHHAKAMAVADNTTVRGDFNDSRFEHGEIDAEFFKRDDRFFVHTQGPDDKQGDFEVKYTFGYEPLQQYLVDIGGGRLQALDIAWDTAKRKWFWLGDGQPSKPGSTFHWTGPFYRWNRTCIDCHSTDPRANFDAATRSYKSSYVATSVGCQSCHGGGARHVDWARKSSTDASARSAVAMPKVEIDTCFACHSRRIKLRDGFRPGRSYLDHFSPALMRQDLYFPDGQIFDEVFEYGSFQQSKMARAGVVCVDCHRPHEGALLAEGNGLCTRCHAETGSARFTSFDPKGTFDSIAHTRHPAGSAGAQCINCHMPQRTYMKVDPRRDHSFVIPRPDLSEAYGIPNACISCHHDRTNAWAGERMDQWYGTNWRNRQTSTHAFAAAAKGDPGSIDALRAFLADREQSGFVRASAVAELARLAGSAAAADVKSAAEDSDPIVRLGAAEAAVNLPPELGWLEIATLLGDEIRAIRVAAVAALGGAVAELPEATRKAFSVAADDFEAYANANADGAEVQGRYGLFLARQGMLDEAERVFVNAVALDPTLAGSHVNLAEFYRVTGESEKSELAYRSAIKGLPDNAALRYGHALALVRLKAMPDAIQEFGAAVRLEPDNTRYRTTFAVGLSSAGRTEEAFSLLDGAITDQTRDADLIGTAIALGIKLGRHGETLTLAKQLARLQPDNPDVAALLRQLRSTSHSRKPQASPN
nr:multiheme c-type cytochrome [Rhizobium sp. P32RR-XVIII]